MRFRSECQYSQPDTGVVNTATNAICLADQNNMVILYLFQKL